MKAGARGWLSRRALGQRLRAEVDAVVGPGFDDPEAYKGLPLPVAAAAFPPIRGLVFVFHPAQDKAVTRREIDSR